MAVDLRTFGRKMKRFAGDLPRQLNVIKQTASIEILNELVDSTPKDTGKTASNWMVGLGARNTSTRESFDRNGNVAKTQGASVIRRALPSQSIIVGNNLEHIASLNAGSSKKAPAGFVQKSVQRGVNSIRRARIKYSKGL